MYSITLYIFPKSFAILTSSKIEYNLYTYNKTTWWIFVEWKENEMMNEYIPDFLPEQQTKQKKINSNKKQGFNATIGVWFKKKQKWIEQKGMTFDHDFCYSFYFSSSLFFRREEKRGKE